MGLSSIKTFNDVWLGLEPAIMSDTMLDAIRGGQYERAEAMEISRIVQPGERILEFGTGIGYIAVSALKTGRVAAYKGFEANPNLIALIERNAELNGVAVEARNAVVTPRPTKDTVPFYIRKDFWASSLSPAPWAYVEKVEVPTIGFDRLREDFRPSMLIVDIEGGELDLFCDVRLTGIRKIYIELHQNIIGRTGIKRIFDFMSSQDFHYDQHHSRGGVVLFSHVLR